MAYLVDGRAVLVLQPSTTSWEEQARHDRVQRTVDPAPRPVRLSTFLSRSATRPRLLIKGSRRRRRDHPAGRHDRPGRKAGRTSLGAGRLESLPPLETAGNGRGCPGLCAHLSREVDDLVDDPGDVVLVVAVAQTPTGPAVPARLPLPVVPRSLRAATPRDPRRWCPPLCARSWWDP